MKLGLNVGYAGSAVRANVPLVQEAERLGFESVWAAEAWGNDVITMLTWYAAQTSTINVGSAIMQIPGRTPAMTAMTAVGLSELSGGRFKLGLGVSGPQVVEGWHGVPYGKPLTKTREYVSIVRAALAREERVTHDGAHYQIPYQGSGATGLGKPLRMICRSNHDIPIYLAAIGPKNVALSAEIADGWLPVFYSPFRAPDVFKPHLDAGFAASGESSKADRFDVAVSAAVAVTDNPEQAYWGVKPSLALYVGGMGAKGKNFYYDLACRYGFEAEAATIQELYLSGKKQEAIAAVPDALVDEVSLIGSPDQIKDRLDVWRGAGVTTFIAITEDVDTLRVLAEVAA